MGRQMAGTTWPSHRSGGFAHVVSSTFAPEGAFVEM